MKKRILSVFLFVVLTVTGAAALTGCQSTKYKIIYHVEHTTNEPTQTTFTLSRNDVDLWVPEVEDGYIFENWYTNKDFNGVAIDYIPAGTKQDMEFYGRVYKRDGYSVSYKIICEGEELEIEPASGKSKYSFAKNGVFNAWMPEESIILGTNQDEYQFEGWYLDEQMEGDTINSILQTSLGDKTLFGEYVKGAPLIPYDITYIIDGVEVETETYKKSRSNRTLFVPSNYDANVEGFDGWYENPNFTGNKVNVIPAGTEGDKTYYGRMREPEGYGEKMNRKKAVNFTLHTGRTETNAELGLYPEFSLSDFYGKPVLLNFWSSNCNPCKKEMPHLQKAYEDYGDQVEFLMINAMALEDTPENAKKFIQTNNYTFPWHHDNGAGSKEKATTAYAIQYFPTTVLIDKWGFVAKTEAKELTSYAEIKGLIELILD